jgi:hypothetical protein
MATILIFRFILLSLTLHPHINTILPPTLIVSRHSANSFNRHFDAIMLVIMSEEKKIPRGEDRLL